MSYNLYDLGDPMKSKKAKGKVAVFPKPNELFLDLDSDEALQTYKNNRWMGVAHFGLVETKRIESSPEHWHVYCKIAADLTPVERMVMECGLGSDPKRALLNFIRIKNDDFPEYASCFFEVKNG